MGKSKYSSYPYHLQHLFLVFLGSSVYIPILAFVENMFLVYKRKQLEVISFNLRLYQIMYLINNTIKGLCLDCFIRFENLFWLRNSAWCVKWNYILYFIWV
jgi:hypothetical protein